MVIFILFQATSPVTPSNSNVGKSKKKSEQRSGNTLYQELAFPDTDTSMVEGEENNYITGIL